MEIKALVTCMCSGHTYSKNNSLTNTHSKNAHEVIQPFTSLSEKLNIYVLIVPTDSHGLKRKGWGENLRFFYFKWLELIAMML